MGKFCEEDVKNIRAFAQFIADKAKFELDWAEAVQLTKYRAFVAELAQKVDDHIIELKKVTEEPKPKKGSK
jgi:hypothetical protein